MGLTEFRVVIVGKLQRSGVVESITAKLRRTVVEVLMENDDHPKHQEHINSFDLESVALRSLIIEFLIVNDMVNTQIVFAIESGLNGNFFPVEMPLNSLTLSLPWLQKNYNQITTHQVLLLKKPGRYSAWFYLSSTQSYWTENNR